MTEVVPLTLRRVRRDVLVALCEDHGHPGRDCPVCQRLADRIIGVLNAHDLVYTDLAVLPYRHDMRHLRDGHGLDFDVITNATARQAHTMAHYDDPMSQAGIVGAEHVHLPEEAP